MLLDNTIYGYLGLGRTVILYKPYKHYIAHTDNSTGVDAIFVKCTLSTGVVVDPDPACHCLYHSGRAVTARN